MQDTGIKPALPQHCTSSTDAVHPCYPYAYTLGPTPAAVGGEHYPPNNWHYRKEDPCAPPHLRFLGRL
jgi:hypothetical protein